MGGAGYTGGELLRILLTHPHAEIAFVHSNSQANKPVSSVHTDLTGETDLLFTNTLPPLPSGNTAEKWLVFLCAGHGETHRILAEYPPLQDLPLIDLSMDFRDETEGFVYGLPELNRDRLRTAHRVANPGCFATAIQLALLPLAQAGMLTHDIHVSAITGSTGAGQKLTDTLHFSWRSDNVSVYKAFTHQHLAEITQSLTYLQTDFNSAIHFIPYRGNFTRGIFASVYTDFAGSLSESIRLFQAYYKDHPYTHVTEQELDIKMVQNTNKCLLHLEKHEDKLLITSVIDNLTKGAAGQAVQNMNLLHGLDEKTGLHLKSIAF